MPVELAQNLLERLGLGRLITNTVTAVHRRNDSWNGVTTTGFPVFIKRLSADDPSCFRRACSFEAVSGMGGIPRLHAPRCHGWDDVGRIQVFEWLREVDVATDLLFADRLTPELARSAGASLAALHSAELGGRSEVERVEFVLPSAEWLAAMPVAVYHRASAGGLHVWRMLQRDTSLSSAIASLLDDERAAPTAMIHGDVRLDQILVERGSGMVYLTDWEEFRVGDPARDTGGFVGDVLCHTALRTLGNTAGLSFPGDEVGGAELPMSDVAVELARTRPLLCAFWHGYGARRSVDDGLARRTVAFAGWHAYDRLIAQAQRSARAPALARAVAGMGRKLLRDPERFVSTFGLTAAAG